MPGETNKQIRQAGDPGSAWLRGACGLLALCLLLAAGSVPAGAVTIAVASNFVVPARQIANEYAAIFGRPVRIVAGSTGKLYAQIVNGAPFDVLLAADAERPLRLEADGRGVIGSRFTYAIGSLVLWSVDTSLSGVDCRGVLRELGDRQLAIANPMTAPYGAAAEQFLRSERLWDAVKARLVFGENIAQTLQFVVTGNASLGLIAASQATDARLPEPSCRWSVPTSTHAAIEQQAILLRDAPSPDDGRSFLEFLHTAATRAVIESHGYSVPQ